jgi:hypothetical protein
MICSIADCGKRTLARGLCAAHYKRWRLYRDPNKCAHQSTPTLRKHNKSQDELVAFLEDNSFSEPNSGCKLFTGDVNPKGYGRIRFDGRSQMVHRVVWEMEYGPLPKGLMTCHKCDTPACIRLDHLYAGTAQDNADDIAKRKRRSCKITMDDVVAIRASSDRHGILAKRYGVSRAMIYAVKAHQVWKHIP